MAKKPKKLVRWIPDSRKRDTGKQSIMTQILSETTPWLATDEACDYTASIEDVPDFQVITLFGEQKLRRLLVIAEMYEKKQFGRVKRGYLSQFTEAERKLLSAWYLKIYAWAMRTGIPRAGVRMSMRTYITLCRFADFFATV